MADALKAVKHGLGQLLRGSSAPEPTLESEVTPFLDVVFGAAPRQALEPNTATLLRAFEKFTALCEAHSIKKFHHIFHSVCDKFWRVRTDRLKSNTADLTPMLLMTVLLLR